MKKALVISTDETIIRDTEKILASVFEIVVFRNIGSALDLVYNEVPDIMLVEIEEKDTSGTLQLNNLKEDPLFSHIPVIALLEDEQTITDWRSLFVEDYLRRDKMERELLSRVMLAITRSARVVEVNPLTKLPGNISINRQLQMRLDRKEIFGFAYADLSEFKPFNDRYGFSRGDEVIKITGRLILNIVKSKQPEGSFVGHIGGDDFVFIMKDSLIQDACHHIIGAFDSIIPTFYDPEDRKNNGINSVDRRGVFRFFSFIGLSIGITSTANRNFTHFGQLTGAASEMKSLAKKRKGSSFSFDKRSDESP